jgi:hypothetical protein
MEKDSAIWEKSQHPDIRKPIQNFLYRALHHSLRIGGFWDNIKNYEHRAHCMLCSDDTESLEHVLLTCRSPERTTIWRTTANIWLVTTFGPWPDITIGTILGCRSLSLEPQQAEIGLPRNPTNRNASRLLHILISEAAHLIWVLCCKCIIGGKTTTHKQ